MRMLQGFSGGWNHHDIQNTLTLLFLPNRNSFNIYNLSKQTNSDAPNRSSGVHPSSASFTWWSSWRKVFRKGTPNMLANSCLKSDCESIKKTGLNKVTKILRDFPSLCSTVCPFRVRLCLINLEVKPQRSHSPSLRNSMPFFPLVQESSLARLFQNIEFVLQKLSRIPLSASDSHIDFWTLEHQAWPPVHPLCHLPRPVPTLHCRCSFCVHDENLSVFPKDQRFLLWWQPQKPTLILNASLCPMFTCCWLNSKHTYNGTHAVIQS